MGVRKLLKSFLNTSFSTKRMKRKQGWPDNESAYSQQESRKQENKYSYTHVYSTGTGRKATHRHKTKSFYRRRLFYFTVM